MAGVIPSCIKWMTDKLCSLLPSATPASSSLMPSEAPNTALEDLKKLVRTMKRIQSILMDAHQRDVRDYSEMHWLQELKQVAYDAEDVVADYDYDVLHAKIQARKMMSGFGKCGGQKSKHQEKVTDLGSISVSVPVSMDIAGRVKKVGDMFEEITRVWDMLRLRESKSPSQHDLSILRRLETGSLVQENSVYGREEDVKNIIKSVFSEDGSNRGDKLRVLPIIGMGGVGKTTLAQLVRLPSPNYKTLVLKDFRASQTLRLVQVLGSHGVNIEIPFDMFHNLRHLRALDFSHVSLTTLPESISNLKQLRYLNLSNTGLKFLPDSICGLHNLQTLELTDCPISEFPNGIGGLVNL